MKTFFDFLFCLGIALLGILFIFATFAESHFVCILLIALGIVCGFLGTYIAIVTDGTDET